MTGGVSRDILISYLMPICQDVEWMGLQFYKRTMSGTFIQFDDNFAQNKIFPSNSNYDDVDKHHDIHIFGKSYDSELSHSSHVIKHLFVRMLDSFIHLSSHSMFQASTPTITKIQKFPFDHA